MITISLTFLKNANIIICIGKLLEANQDVFVTLSKIQYEAKIVTNHNPRFQVSFSSRKEHSECDVSQIQAMNKIGKRKKRFPGYFSMESPVQKSMKGSDDESEWMKRSWFD